MNCHAYLPLFPIPLRRGSNLSPDRTEKVLHVEQREVLTAIAAGQLLIRSPVMESGGLLALL